MSRGTERGLSSVTPFTLLQLKLWLGTAGTELAPSLVTHGAQSPLRGDTSLAWSSLSPAPPRGVPQHAGMTSMSTKPKYLWF